MSFIRDLPGDQTGDRLPFTWLSPVNDSPEEVVEETINVVLELDPIVFRNPRLQNALLEKLTDVLALIETGELCDLCEARNQLMNDILPKMDGETPPPDWIVDRTAQQEVEDLVLSAIELLQNEIDELGSCGGC